MSDPVKVALDSGEWVEKLDAKSKKKYYYNPTTKKTTWDLAKDLAKEGKDNKASSPKVAAKKLTLQDVLAEGEWVEKTDNKSNKKYYYNTKTRKTTWDLVKDLGLSKEEGSTTSSAQTASATTTASTVASSPTGKFASIGEALSSGDWIEKKDSKSGKVYYYNPKTRKTVWDLEKELQLTADVVSPVGSSQAATTFVPGGPMVAPHVPQQKCFDPQQLLSSGEWKTKKDFQGKDYYYNPNTGESCGDLVLYMQIQQAIDSDVSQGPTTSLPTTKRSTDSSQITSQVTHFDDWVSMMLHSPGYEDSTDRLLRQHQFISVTEKDRLELEKNLSESEERIQQLESVVKDLNRVNLAQQSEIHQLQCALFYGLGPVANNYTPPMLHAVDDSYGTHEPRRIASPRGDFVSSPQGDRSNLEYRVKYLERVVFKLQGHNRYLVTQLENERTSKHECNQCAHCGERDPWRRLMSGVSHMDKKFPLDPTL